MKILIICSKSFYGKIEEVKGVLEGMGHEIFLPNCYDAPQTEKEMWNMGKEAHRQFKAKMFKQSEDVISKMDAVVVLNYDKIKDSVVNKNYIGGATFLEMYDAFRLNKKIFMLNEIPNNMLSDEIDGFDPVVLNGDLSKVR